MRKMPRHLVAVPHKFILSSSGALDQDMKFLETYIKAWQSLFRKTYKALGIKATEARHIDEQLSNYWLALVYAEEESAEEGFDKLWYALRDFGKFFDWFVGHHEEKEEIRKLRNLGETIKQRLDKVMLRVES